MQIHAYLFEAKSIQSFILDSGKLRDLVGASGNDRNDRRNDRDTRRTDRTGQTGRTI